MRRRHPDVDHNHIRSALAHLFVQLPGISSLADDFVAGPTQEAGDPLAKEDIVVCQNHAPGHALSLRRRRFRTSSAPSTDRVTRVIMGGS